MLSLQGGSPNLYGPQSLGLFTPQNGEGLGLPGGQTSFNLPRSGAPTPSMNFSISRTASSDPVQNIINDIQNPLGGLNVTQQQQQQPQGMPGGGFGLRSGGAPANPFAPIGTDFRSRMMGGASQATLSPFAFL